tara:strand:+ start:142 stop:351 length:210 start_codon:yes stop_codon:yes gene_type:complete
MLGELSSECVLLARVVGAQKDGSFFYRDLHPMAKANTRSWHSEAAISEHAKRLDVAEIAEGYDYTDIGE